MNPFINHLVKKYMNPDTISDYLIKMVNNAISDDPQFIEDWKKVTVILVYCIKKDPQFVVKLQKALGRLMEIVVRVHQNIYGNNIENANKERGE